MYCEKDSNNRTKNRGNLLVWCLIFALMAAIAIGDAEQVAATGGVNESGQSEIEAIGSEETSVDMTIQSITFKKDIGIRDALRFLAAKYQKNIIPSSKVDGLVTVTSLYDVTFEEALDAILGYAFKYEQQGNFIKIYTAEEYKQFKEDKSRMTHKVFTLYYTTAEEAKNLIKPVLSSFATIAASSAAKTDTEAGDGGDSLASRDVLVVYDYPENIENISKMLDVIDVKPPEILIEVTILEAELSDDTEFGIDLSSIGGTAITSGSTEGIRTRGLASAVTGTAGLTAALSIDDVTGFIRALEDITNTTVLANPKILALNKQAGHVLIGAEDGYITTSQISADGAVQQVEFLESGTTLKFRPYICDNGYIRMEINPEQSEGSVAVEGGFVLPSKTTTQVKTNIMVKDGKTIVIGGLFKEQIEQTYSQVPVIGDLPFVGSIFKRVNDSSTRKELIILITPHIINNLDDTEGVARSEDVKKIIYGARKSLNWISRARLFDDRYAKAVKDYVDGNHSKALSELNYLLRAQPEFLEAIRLKERIISEISPDEVRQMERIMLSVIEQEESPKWLRRR
jgi:type II secretory pathway component GspD/PulD (secretin)